MQPHSKLLRVNRLVLKEHLTHNYVDRMFGVGRYLEVVGGALGNVRVLILLESGELYELDYVVSSDD